MNFVEKKLLKIENEKRALINEKCSLEKTIKQLRDGQSSTICEPDIESNKPDDEKEVQDDETVNYVKGKSLSKVQKTDIILVLTHFEKPAIKLDVTTPITRAMSQLSQGKLESSC